MSLNLTRRYGEAIVITSPAGPVTVRVYRGANAGRVTLIVDAPHESLILREELTNQSTTIRAAV